MKIFIRGAAAALALSLVGVSGAEAQIACQDAFGGFKSITGTFGSPATYTWTAATYTDCAGPLDGVASGSDADAEASSLLPGATSEGKTDAGDTSGEGPFQPFDEDLAIPLNLFFDVPVTGSFVIALKSADGNASGDGGGYSLYHFDGAVDWVGLQVTTVGVSTNDNDQPRALSHASLWTTRSVPEPGTMLLLGTGLLGMAFARRRKDEIEA